MAVKTRTRLLRPRRRHRHRRRSCRPPRWSRRPPASSCSRTRRWSAPTPSRMPRGIHQDGVLKARDTYEIMRAEDVGWSANKIVLGKLSGRNAFKQRLQELGIELGQRGRRQHRVRALQGAGRPQERDLRRGHPRAGDGGRGRCRRASTTASSACRSTRKRAPVRRPASLSRPASSSTARRATATSSLAPHAATGAVIHPLWVRVTHWINALAMLVMIGSGWQIYDASPLFDLEFPSRSHWATGSPAHCSGISPRCGCW